MFPFVLFLVIKGGSNIRSSCSIYTLYKACHCLFPFWGGSVTRTTQANALTQHVTPSTLTVVKDLVKMISYIALRLLELAGQTSPVVKRLPLLITTIQPAQSILRIVRSAVVGFTENFEKNLTFYIQNA